MEGQISVEELLKISPPATPEALDDLKASLDIRYKRRIALFAALQKARNKRERGVAQGLLEQNNVFLRAIAKAIWQAHNPHKGSVKMD